MMSATINKPPEDEIRELFKKVLGVYDVPEVCIENALTYIYGLKAGARLVKSEKEAAGKR